MREKAPRFVPVTNPRILADIRKAMAEGFGDTTASHHGNESVTLVGPKDLTAYSAGRRGGHYVVHRFPAADHVYSANMRSAKRTGDRRTHHAIGSDEMGLYFDHNASQLSGGSWDKYAHAWTSEPGQGRDPYAAYEEFSEVAAYGPFAGEVFDDGDTLGELLNDYEVYLFENADVAFCLDLGDLTWRVYVRYGEDEKTA